MKTKKITTGIIIVLIAIFLIGIYLMSFSGSYKFKGEGPIKIFFLNSYHEDFEWSYETINSFKEVFRQEGINIEMKQINFDSFRDDSQENFENKKNEAIKIIEEWKPDLIYAGDDISQKAITQYVNTNTPIVFSGLNEEPEKYGYDKARNVAGVLERVHVVDTIEFLKTVYPGVKKVAVFSDDMPQWDGIIDEIEKNQNVYGIEFVGVHRLSSFEVFKEKLLDYQDKIDAFVFAGMTDYKDKGGNNIPLPVFLEWVIINSKLPTATFWDVPIKGGLLLGVSVSPSEQGKAAGQFAYKILIDGKEPSDLNFKPTTKGNQAINLKRAKTLGIEQDDLLSTILVNSDVYETYSWEENSK